MNLDIWQDDKTIGGAQTSYTGITDVKRPSRGPQVKWSGEIREVSGVN